MMFCVVSISLEPVVTGGSVYSMVQRSIRKSTYRHEFFQSGRVLRTTMMEDKERKIQIVQDRWSGP